jgi:hypothetical protein
MCCIVQQQSALNLLVVTTLGGDVVIATQDYVVTVLKNGFQICWVIFKEMLSIG